MVFNTHGQDSEYNHRSGETVEILRPCTKEECDIEDVGPMYYVKFLDGIEIMAFEDELEE